ncbi:RIR1 [Hepatospora eriocheir]|uniref:RIR1 n=1 Tax=Hepatospora eriocheir TaxID=1081669 RepID=A0A1X0QEG9_9MICR|nr:RIR1 [Hepatospora eriocheir]
MNLFLKTPTYAQLTSTHFYGWKSGLITGMYYLRMVPVSSTIKFTIDKDKLNRTIESMKSESFNLKTTTTDNDSLLECEGCSL